MGRSALVIPTRNGEKELSRLLASIWSQNVGCDVFVVDSSSSDRTVDVAERYGATVHSIDVAEFNHGGTRQMMVTRHPGYDIYVFMTQDAYLSGDDSLGNILSYFDDLSVGAVCGRQIPHKDALPLAAHARTFNYPSRSDVKSMRDAERLGVKTPFLSNSFAAYRGSALASVGGFPKNVIVAEDMFVAAKMLLAGWKVAYAGDACCHHSHNYTVRQEFGRYFDVGVFYAREPWIRASFGGAGGEGVRFALSEMKYLGVRRLCLWPSSVTRSIVKLIGYRMGRRERRLPVWLKSRISMHKGFWRNDVRRGGW